MKTTPCTRSQRGLTLVELMVASGIGAVVIAVVAVLIVFAARSFAVLANCQALAQASSVAVDQMSREIREATGVIGFQDTGNQRWMVFANTNASPPYSLRYEWSAADRLLTARRSDESAERVLLSGCDQWDFVFHQRTPMPGPGFGFSTNLFDPVECKLVTMTWKCSRALSGTGLINSETVQTAQIVIRNQKTP